ncbi:MAG: hypothetical protein ACTSXG_03265 [Alphaproteobacteria bacterium]
MNDKKNNFNEDLNALFERLMASKDKKLKSVEAMKQRITAKLDKEISRLYTKKDFITEMWAKREELRSQKMSVFKNIMDNSLAKNLRILLSMPFIYIIVIPAIFLHLIVELYHQICFRLYGLERVKAREYFVFDRRLLPYLNWFEKFNCMYCSYFICLISYIKEIGGRTERYWCPIKHSKVLKDQHSSYKHFVDYLDGETLREKWDELRKTEENLSSSS